MKMNWKKTQAIAGSILLGIASVFAASGNEKGIEFFRAELFDAAKIELKNQVAQSEGTALAEAFYYIGKSYLATNQLDSAAIFFRKAIETDPEYPYGHIGEGMLALRNNNAKLADDLFKKALSLDKKDPAVPVAIVAAFIELNQYAKAEEFLDKARKINKKFSGIYVAEGDMLMSQGDIGGASSRYENAIYFNPNDKLAHLKKARVYKAINPDLALEILLRLLEIDPSYIPAFAELGDVYYKMNNYTKAIEAYRKFIEIPGVPVERLINYASLLYFTKEYAQSLEIINKVLASNPENFVMRRLQFYNNFELGNYTLGLKQAEKFIQTGPQGELIAQDFVYYGRLLSQSGNIAAAIDAFNKALTIDPEKTDVFRDLALAYEAKEDFSNAIVFYKKFIENDKNATLGDVFNLGRMAYTAGRQEITGTPEEIAADALVRKNFLMEADAAFAQMIERSPDSYLGYFWRGRVNFVLDPETTLGLAKPFYEQAANILAAMPEGSTRNSNLVESYRYLVFYYYSREDFPAAKDFAQRILDIDPTNDTALQVLKAIK
ncbi:MAG: tetratricopeptide repeat protein [Dysgonamonadaceae bacterium]|nr:tetratricopeptide repeat protein [Dysgonamonadaceae bacterium]